MRRRTLPILGAAALLACATASRADGPLKMDAETQARLGVRTAPLAAAHRSAGAAGFARGLDATPLATLDADLTAAAASAQASAAEAARTAALAKADSTVSRKVAEAAAAQARGDAAKAALLRRRVGLEWGPRLAAMGEARRGRLLSEIAAGRAALVRIDRVGSAGDVGAGPATLDLGPHGRAAAAVLGPARASDPRAVTPGLLALVTGPAAAWVGTGAAVPVSFAGAAGPAGVVIPREALLRTAGSTFAYVRRDAESFERRPVTGGAPQPDGLFAPTGFRPGEAVVVAGAAKLFAAEKTPAKED